MTTPLMHVRLVLWPCPKKLEDGAVVERHTVVGIVVGNLQLPVTGSDGQCLVAQLDGPAALSFIEAIEAMQIRPAAQQGRDANYYVQNLGKQ